MLIENSEYLIRRFETNDYHDLYEYLSKKDIYKYEPGDPIDIEEAKQLVKERSNNDNFLAVILKSEKKLIGHFSFFQIEPKYISTYEIGYIFNPKYHGKGHVTKSGKMLIEYYFKDQNIHRIISNCNPENENSWKLLERLGFKREGYLIKNIYFRKENERPIWLNTYLYGLLNPYED